MRETGKFLTKLWKDESGISSVEYALLLAFVAAGIIAAASNLSDAVQGEMNNAAECIKGTAAADCT
jgi:Flp pilus assembly pilin Flp